MNRNIFKVIFSKRTGKLTVVSEITTSTGKTASESTGSASWGYNFAVNPLSFVLMLTMGTAAAIPANAQVVADGNAPGNQRPTILNTASGATQVNIMTPSAAGVSMNQYSRFDVNNPLILNNSRTSVNTQTAGMVQGNPFLATGSARIIVNQVNGNLARINNSIEIAGPRSELIIAAPAGIIVNGGTILNASRTTLTTGSPIINGGNLEGYRVTQGQFTAEGQGLDTSDSDYTDILARSVQANAGIWAKNLNVVTGANQIDRNNSATQIAGEGVAPSIAIDTGALGGMYAGKIYLTSTENGVGVNNAGQIAASAGAVAISNDGLLTNSGTISSNGQDNATSINTSAVRNSGTISAQGNTQIQTSAELQSSGTVTAGRELKVNSNTIDNSNGVLNGQRIDITTNSLNNTQGKIQQTGFTQALALNAGNINNVNNGVIGYAPEAPSSGGSSSGSGSSTGSTSGSTGTDTPTTAAGGGTSTVVQPAPLPTLTDGVINVTGTINNDAGQITANGGIDLTSTNGLTNHATLNLNKLTVSGNSLDNSSGTITTTQLTANTNSINNTLGKLGSSGNINLTAQTLTNSGGQITSSGSLAANIAQTVLNDNGVLASTNALTLSSGSLNNINGTISANTANADVTSSGAIDNTKGTIQAATALNVTGSGLNNTDGKVNGTTTIVNAQTGALNNTRGSIAGDNLTITSGALTNDAGLIQGSQALAINTQGQTLTNINSGTANGIVSGGTLEVQSGNLNNNTGSISSNADTTISATHITSQSGSITSLGNATITGTGFDNQGGQIQSIGNTTVNLGGGTFNNSNGLVRTDGNTTINANTVNNSNTNGTDKGIEGANVTLNANNVDNTSGAIRADETLSIIGTGTVNNTSGLITSSNTVVIKDSNAATNPSAKTQTVINTNGTISAGQSNTIDSKSLTGDGKLTSNQDLSISINTDYANTGELTADGKLTLNTTGNINNTAKISAGSDLNVSAQNIDNAANAEINGNTTSIHANDTLTNRGLIDGGDTVVTAGNTINNIGTGRIYGNNLSVGTTTLNNIDETINGVNKAATIAAREDLDIGAQTINNIEHSSLISLGDMRIGGALDSNNQATGKAAVINNNSATIESTGDMSINVGQLNNRNMHFAISDATQSSDIVSSEQRYYYRGGVGSPFAPLGVGVVKNTTTGAIVNNPNQATGSDALYGAPGYDEEFYFRDVIADTYRSQVTQTDPGKIISGGAMNINLDNGLNDKSQIIAGGALTITGGSLTNQNATGTEVVREHGKVVHTNLNGSNRAFDTLDPSYNNEFAPTTITLDNIAVQQQNVNAGSGNTVAAHGSTAAGNANGAGQANAITEIYATDTADPTMIRTGGVNTAIPNSSLFSVNPNGNGYLIATDPRFIDASRWLSSDYMLKALNLDPANIHKRLGDAYYEQKLIKEQIAQLTGRRYLDGQTSDDDQYKALMNAGVTFANQYNLRPGIALTPEQIARLTSDIVWLVEQTVTLPDGTTTTALVPQVYVRTRPGDITGNGALISGSSVKLNLTGDLNNQGNIAGRTLVKIDANNINNLNGRIGAGADATILNAKTDINNIGGTIEANNQLVVKAGRDVNVITTTSTATATGKRTQTSNTGVDRIAGLYVNNPDGLLIVDAGNNVNLKGADVVAVDGGITSINAKNDINAGTVEVSSTINTSKDGKNYVNDTSTAEVGSFIGGGTVYLDAGNDVNARQVAILADDGPIVIKAGNNVTLDAGMATSTSSGAFAEKHGKKKLSANGESKATTDVGSALSGQGISIQAGNANTPAGQGNISMTAAQVDAGEGALIIKAKNDVNIEEGRDTLETATHWESSKKGFLKKKSNTTDHELARDSSIASNLTGGTVTIVAGNDYTQTGSNVVGIGNVAIQAGNNVTIESSQDHYSESNSEETKKSGLMGGYDAGVISIGYGKSKAAAQNSIDITAQNASTVASLNGNTTIKAGNHMTIAASDVSAGENLTLIAKDIDLEARQDTVDEHHAQQSKSSGFSIGLTVNPYAAFNSAYKQTLKNTPTSGAVGKVISQVEAVTDGVKAALTPVVVQAGSHKSSASQDHATSTARTSSLNAGNNMTVIATEGSIDSQGTQMSAEGDALFLARDNINFDVAHNYESADSNSKASGWSIDNRGQMLGGWYNNKGNGDGITDTITGTQLSVGGSATLGTTKGDITLTAANIVANENVNINAARNLTVQSGQDTTDNENHSSNKAIGRVVISDTERFSGYHSEKHNDNSAAVTQVSSNIASLGGNVNLKAGEKYTQIASNVMAANDVNVTAKSIELLTAQNTGVAHQDDKSLMVGTFARVYSPLIDLANNVEAARQSDGRLKSLQNMAAVANGVQAVAAATGVTGALAGVEVGIGVRSDKSRSDQEYSVAQGSAISAGGNLNLTSTEGDIHGVQASLTAGKTLSLDSANNILLEAGKSTTESSGKQSGWGAEIGVGAQVGAQTGVYVYGSANVSSGKYETSSTTYGNTHLSGETINIKSKGDTTLRGADAHANTINADIGGKLAIESLQDTAEQHSQESGGGVRVQVGIGNAWGVSGSGNVSIASGDGTFTGVNQQSGLFAGNGGYHVKADTVDLKGGAITSTNAANSDLTANALTFSDLENKSSYDTSSTTLSGSSQSSVASNIAGNLGNVVNMLGNGQPTEETSTTRATLTEGNITIGGQSTSAAATGINTDAANAHQALTELPDIRALMAEQQAEQQAVNTIGQGVAIVVSEAVKAGAKDAVSDAQAAAQALKDAQAAAEANPNETTAANLKAAEQALTDANNEVKHWGPDGRYTIATQAVSTIVMGLVSDRDPKAIAAMVAAPLVAQAIGDQIGADNTAAKFAAHAVAAGLIAALSGADTKEALAAGLAAGLTESVIAPAIVKALYGDQYDVNNPEQRETILALSGVSGAIIAGIAGDSTDAAAYGAAGSLNAVANNFLNHDDAAALAKAFNEVCKGDAACEADAINKAQKAYDRNEAALDLAILHGDLAEYERLLATAAPASAIPNTGIRMFADRADSLAQGINNQTNERTISQIATLRGQMCGGMEPSACDARINELRVQGDQRALALMAILSGAGLGRTAAVALLTRFTTVPAKSVASAAIGSGAFSASVYGLVNQENSTPAGILASFGIGAATGAMGYGMNVAAGLSATTIPTTVGGAVIKANTAGIGTALGPVRNTTTSTGNSWLTSPLFKKK